MYKTFLKRVIDTIISFSGLIILSPIMIIVAFLIKIKLGSPVLFRQKRPGLNGDIFTIYKFRTMINETDKNGERLPDHERLTAFGKFLRASSLDELPELFNIFKGDMAIVGPRPLLVAYLPLYNEQQKKRHHVRPGLTGLAQINGRNTLSWQDKFNYDVSYVEDLSFINDLKIFFGTFHKVLKRDGISQEGAATMTRFMGNDNE